MIMLLFLLATIKDIIFENTRNKNTMDLKISNTVNKSYSPFCLITSAKSILLIIQTPNTLRQLLASA